MSIVTEARDIHIARIETDVRQCWLAFRELRPHLQSENEFVERWRKQMEEGYQVVYVKDGDKVVAAAGYRFLNTMAWGHILYIDDLVALQTSHRTGLGTLLRQYLQSEARDGGCDAVHLDTGYQRHLAHGSYLRNGFHMDCHHMAWPVKPLGNSQP
jgi:GNAT superfamily N-acetyltransferase